MKSLDTAIESFRIVYKNPKIIVIPFVMYILSFVLIFAIGLSFGINTLLGGDLSSIFSSVFLLIIFLLLIIAFLIYPIFNGMLISSGIQAVKGKLSLSKAFEETKKKYLSLLGVSLISAGIFLSLFIPLIFLILVGIIFHTSDFGGGGIFIMSIFIIIYLILVGIASIFLLASLFEANVLVFTENKKAVEAVKRSFYIGKKKFLSIFASLFFLFIVALGIGFVLGIFGILFNFIDEILGLPIFGILFLIFVEIPIHSFISSSSSILPVVFYYNYDLRKL
jgi:MFS family permease